MTEPRALTASATRGFAWRFLQASGWLFVAYLAYAQLLPAIDYQLGVRMGTQEPATRITAVGVAFWRAFAIADLAVYTPLLVAGLVGHSLGKNWGRIALAAAFGITVYWPVVSLAAVVAARGAPGWDLPKEGQYWIVLPTISLWGAYGLWYLMREKARIE